MHDSREVSKAAVRPGGRRAGAFGRGAAAERLAAVGLAAVLFGWTATAAGQTCSDINDNGMADEEAVIVTFDFELNFDAGSSPPTSNGDPLGNSTVIGPDLAAGDAEDPFSNQNNFDDPGGDNYQPFGELGITVFSPDSNGVTFSGGSGVLVILDSTLSNGNDDPDLRSPNNDCTSIDPGWTDGPGVGVDGAPSNCDENTTTAPTGDVATNLLILQENASGTGPCAASTMTSDPDSEYCPDDPGGGAGNDITFTFADPAPVEIIESSHLDFEGADTLNLQFFTDEEGTDPITTLMNVTQGATVGDVGDNAFIRINIQSAMNQCIADGSGCTVQVTQEEIEEVQRVEFQFTGSGSINDVTFCFAPDTTPVTLNSFHAEAGGGGVDFTWSTETEFQNAGFYLEERVDGRWRRINETLIPSHAIDSLKPLTYEYSAVVSGREFRVIDVSTRMRERRHGPFELGRHYGGSAEVAALDLSNAKAERRSKRAHRSARQLLDKLQRLHRREARRISMRQSGHDRRMGRGQSRLRELAQLFYDEPIILSRGGAGAGIQSEFPAMDLLVEESGIHRVSYAQLREAGLDLIGVPVGDLALTNRGIPVPIRVEPSRGRFGPGGFVEFLGEGLDSLYTKTNRYQVHVDPRLAERVEVDTRRVPFRAQGPASYTEAVTVDDNNQYAFFSTTGDPWYNRRLTAHSGSPRRNDFELSVDAVRPGDAVLHLRGYGVTDFPAEPDHKFNVELNGVPLNDQPLVFDGLVDIDLSLPVPDGVLVEGENLLTVHQPADIPGVSFDMVNIDSYGVEYSRGFVYPPEGQLGFTSRSRVFEVDGVPGDAIVYRDGETPVYKPRVRQVGSKLRFRGDRSRHTYVVSTTDGLLSPGIEPTREPEDILDGKADYLVIARGDFIKTLEPLVSYRQAQGWNVRVVDVADVFSHFSYGIFDAQAIADYIEEAKNSMGTEMVLLVGWDSYDYLDYQGSGTLSAIPTLYVDVGNGATFTPSDPALADTDGDGVPDLPIGRLPAYSSGELAEMIDKIIAYETSGLARSALFAADNDEPGTPFTRSTQNLRAALPADWTSTEALIDVQGFSDARQTLIDTLNAGVAWTTFVGHSGPNSWTFDGLLTTNDVDNLTNNDFPTAVTQWGCWNTYHVSPEIDTMAHRFMLGETGAASVLGASTVTTVTADGKFSPLLQGEVVKSGSRIGEAVQNAKLSLQDSHPGMLEIQLGITLLADPAMVITP